MLGKIENGNLVVVREDERVLRVHKEEIIQIPETVVNEETGDETTTYKEKIKVKEYVVANPREQDFIEAGYKEIVDGERLPDKEGFYQSPIYTDDGDKIITTYEYKEIVEDDIG